MAVVQGSRPISTPARVVIIVVAFAPTCLRNWPIRNEEVCRNALTNLVRRTFIRPGDFAELSGGATGRRRESSAG